MDQRIAKVVELMRGNLRFGLTPEALAQVVNLSPSRLHQVFKDETGVSPAKYLKTLRLERAKELLEGSFLSVKEIRVMVGFGDESHFARDFKKHFGLTPTQCRARHSSGDRGGGGAVAAVTSSPAPAHEDPGGDPATAPRDAEDGRDPAAPTSDDLDVLAFALPAFG
jgi:AraC-like DNA-binding protein